MESNIIYFDKLGPFDFNIKYSETAAGLSENEFEHHIHATCEIYINISGDVSFMVENTIYPIRSGSIIITRPYEHHHCIYHSNAPHKHFWILFSADRNEELFPIFYNRKKGEKNLLISSPEELASLCALCQKLINPPNSTIESYYNFFKLLNMINNTQIPHTLKKDYPQDVDFAISYINTNFMEPLLISDLAERSHVSINTLERHFHNYIGLSPSAYIRQKRLSQAANLLHKGSAVTEACEQSGFSDYSNFIALFRKTYGMTPHKYKKYCDRPLK